MTDRPLESSQLQTYAQFLEKIRLVLVALEQRMAPDAVLIVIVRNLHLGRRFVPLAWDVARMMSDRFELCEERVLVYPEPQWQQTPDPSLSNQAHEYALIARKQATPIDLDDTLACLKELVVDHPNFVLYGSFARWLHKESLLRLPG